MISMSSWNDSPHSKHATTRPRNRSSGSSPPPTWSTSQTDSTATDRRSPPTQHSPEPPDPRRIYGRDHLVVSLGGKIRSSNLRSSGCTSSLTSPKLCVVLTLESDPNRLWCLDGHVVPSTGEDVSAGGSPGAFVIRRWPIGVVENGFDDAPFLFNGVLAGEPMPAT